MNTQSRAVLIVDDDHQYAALLRHALVPPHGECTVTVVDTLQAARALLAQQNFDVLLVDLVLPDGQGTELLNPAEPERPVVIITAYGDEKTAVQAIKAGAFDYLAKSKTLPTTIAVVVERVSREWRIHQERRRIEQAFKESEERMRSLVETAADGIITADGKGIIDSFNQAAEELFQYKASEVLGQPLGMLMPQQFAAHHQKYIQRYLDTGEAHVIGSGREVDIRRKDGTLVTVQLSIGEMKLHSGRYFTAIMHDMSKRKLLERQFHQAQKMEAVGRLAGGVAHDFNNLLTVINGYADLLAEAMPPTDPLRPLIDEIAHAGNRAAVLTRQLLTVSRRQVLSLTVLNLNVVVKGINSLLLRLIGEDIKLHTDTTFDLGLVEADLGQMEQVILNLAVNARDAMNQGGTVTLSTANVELRDSPELLSANLMPGRYVRLSVRDTGCGMDEKVKVRIFEPFFTTKSHDKGTGLGLATVYGIVRQSGGFIEVESTVGQGSCFHIFLPRVDKPEVVAPAVEVEDKIPHGHEIILLVEDESPVRIFAREVLRKHGYYVLEAANGLDAMRMVRQSPQELDLLVTDVVMPYMNGRELFETLRQMWPHLRCVFLSGYNEDATLSAGLLPDSAFLPKPFTPQALARRVREMLDIPPENFSQAQP